MLLGCVGAELDRGVMMADLNRVLHRSSSIEIGHHELKIKWILFDSKRNVETLVVIIPYLKFLKVTC